MKFLVSMLAFRPGKIGGAETALLELLQALSELLPSGTMRVLSTPENSLAIQKLAIEQIPLAIPDSSMVRFRAIEAFTPFRCPRIEKRIDASAYDFVWFPQQSIFPKNVGGRTVLTVYDLQHYQFPANFSVVERLYRAAVYPRSIRRADHLITISAQSRSEVLRYFPGSSDKMTAILLGANHVPSRPSPVLPDVEPFLFCPAATYVHKNHEALIRAVAALHVQGQWKWKIVLSGQKTDYYRKLRRLMDDLHVRQWFEHVGFVSRDRLQLLYQGCLAVLFPSKYEGFGLPVVEASSYHKPILVSDLPIYDELGVPVACRVDFDQPAMLLEALQSLHLRMAHLPHRSWRQCAIEHLELFEKLVCQWSK